MTLIEEIERGETQTLEFKRIPNAERVKYQKTAVAFANGRGGRILFGVAKASNGCRESSIGNKKLPIERRKLPIDGQELPFESIVADRKLSRPSRNHLAALYKEVAAESHFDVQTASSILGMSERTVRNLLAGARSKGIIVSVPGHGKGKYRFAAPVAAARRDMV